MSFTEERCYTRKIIVTRQYLGVTLRVSKYKPGQNINE